MSNKEIARELGISLRTAQNHIANIFRKLELNDRVSAAIYAINQGFAKPRDGADQAQSPIEAALRLVTRTC